LKSATKVRFNQLKSTVEEIAKEAAAIDEMEQKGDQNQNFQNFQNPQNYPDNQENINNNYDKVDHTHNNNNNNNNGYYDSNQPVVSPVVPPPSIPVIRSSSFSLSTPLNGLFSSFTSSSSSSDSPISSNSQNSENLNSSLWAPPHYTPLVPISPDTHKHPYSQNMNNNYFNNNGNSNHNSNNNNNNNDNDISNNNNNNNNNNNITHLDDNHHNHDHHHHHENDNGIVNNNVNATNPSTNNVAPHEFPVSSSVLTSPPPSNSQNAHLKPVSSPFSFDNYFTNQNESISFDFPSQNQSENHQNGNNYSNNENVQNNQNDQSNQSNQNNELYENNQMNTGNNNDINSNNSNNLNNLPEESHSISYQPNNQISSLELIDENNNNFKIENFNENPMENHQQQIENNHNNNNNSNNINHNINNSNDSNENMINYNGSSPSNNSDSPVAPIPTNEEISRFIEENSHLKNSISLVENKLKNVESESQEKINQLNQQIASLTGSLNKMKEKELSVVNTTNVYHTNINNILLLQQSLLHNFLSELNNSSSSFSPSSSSFFPSFSTTSPFLQFQSQISHLDSIIKNHEKSPLEVSTPVIYHEDAEKMKKIQNSVLSSQSNFVSGFNNHITQCKKKELNDLEISNQNNISNIIKSMEEQQKQDGNNQSFNQNEKEKNNQNQSFDNKLSTPQPSRILPSSTQTPSSYYSSFSASSSTSHSRSVSPSPLNASTLNLSVSQSTPQRSLSLQNDNKFLHGEISKLQCNLSKTAEFKENLLKWKEEISSKYEKLKMSYETLKTKYKEKSFKMETEKKNYQEEKNKILRENSHKIEEAKNLSLLEQAKMKSILYKEFTVKFENLKLDFMKKEEILRENLSHKNNLNLNSNFNRGEEERHFSELNEKYNNAIKEIHELKIKLNQEFEGKNNIMEEMNRNKLIMQQKEIQYINNMQNNNQVNYANNMNNNNNVASTVSPTADRSLLLEFQSKYHDLDRRYLDLQKEARLMIKNNEEKEEIIRVLQEEILKKKDKKMEEKENQLKIQKSNSKEKEKDKENDKNNQINSNSSSSTSSSTSRGLFGFGGQISSFAQTLLEDVRGTVTEDFPSSTSSPPSPSSSSPHSSLHLIQQTKIRELELEIHEAHSIIQSMKDENNNLKEMIKNNYNQNQQNSFHHMNDINSMGQPLSVDELKHQLFSLREENERIKFEVENSHKLVEEYNKMRENVSEKDKIIQILQNNLMEKENFHIEEIQRANREIQHLAEYIQKLQMQMEESNIIKNKQKEKEQENNNQSNQNDKNSSSSLDDSSALLSQLNLTREQLFVYEKTVSQLQDENSGLLRNFNTLSDKMRQFSESEGSNLIDRRLVVSILVSLFESRDPDQVLLVMFRILQFDQEEKIRVSNARNKGFGSKRGFSRFAAILSPFDPEAPMVDENSLKLNNKTIADLWVEFLVNSADGKKKINNLNEQEKSSQLMNSNNNNNISNIPSNTQTPQQNKISSFIPSTAPPAMRNQKFQQNSSIQTKFDLSNEDLKEKEKEKSRERENHQLNNNFHGDQNSHNSSIPSFYPSSSASSDISSTPYGISFLSNNSSNSNNSNPVESLSPPSQNQNFF
jgi:hypothetical protein